MIAMKRTGELIQAYFDAFNAKDVESRLSLMSDDVAHDLNEGGRQIGRDAFRDFIVYMDERYEEQIVNLVVMENGDRGAAEFTVVGKYVQSDEGLPAANGQSYRIPAAAFFEARDGLITRVTSYYNLQQWIAAVS